MFSKQFCTCVFRNRGFETRLRKSLPYCNKICSRTSSLQVSFHTASASGSSASVNPPVHHHRRICFNKTVPRREKVTFTKRTHLCGELSVNNIGDDVCLCGWVVYSRLVGTFLVIKDWTGLVQLFVSEELANSKICYESVVEVCGKVRARPEGMENKNMSTGDIEVEVSSISILNDCKPDLPMDLRDVVQNKESVRMEYRYLDIRSKQMQNNLRLRSSVIMKMREFLSNQHGFVDVETPSLFRRTPGGAKEFVVPSRQYGKFYSLPQSPQQFKQLLMVGGIDRYYQVAKCYRDEGSRPDRQPEFTQVDIEMSFVQKNDIQSLIEQLLQFSWPADKGKIDIPFPRMTYQQAMEDYGSDKPDLRYDLKIERLTDILKDSGENMWAGTIQDGDNVIGIRLPNGMNHLSKKEIATQKEAIKHVKGRIFKIKSQADLNGEINQQIANKLKLETGDVVVTATGSGYLPHTALGRVRTMFTKKMDDPPEKFNFLWVEDFPLFLQKEDGEEGLESAHHPFTAPHKDDLDLLYSQPDKVRSEHYDLVLNGAEIGGGSIRIHNSKLQSYVLQNILKEDTSELEHLLKALEYGCPPHGGIALGLDRYLAILCGVQSIRDVIAFPKTQEGNDLMSKAPSTITDKDLDLYHIQVKPLKSSENKGS